MRQESTQTLPRRPGQFDSNRVVWQTLLTVPLCDLVAEDRTHGPIDVDDRRLDLAGTVPVLQVTP